MPPAPTPPQDRPGDSAQSGGPACPPIVIFGVPRSGTTLLRTLLDAHPAIAAGPEAPWLAEHQPRSAMGLARYLAEDPHGAVANFGASRGEVFSAVRQLVDEVMGGYARRRGKRRWAHKTPNDILRIETVLELLPDARIIWIVRNGLDVALSTAITAEHRRGVAPLYEKNLRLAPELVAPLSPVTALLRWGLWNHRVRRALAGRERLTLRYEDLVQAPEVSLRAVCEFIGEPFDPAMLRYDTSRHDLPAWEWGSADVRAHGGIVAERAGRGQRELDDLSRRALAVLTDQEFARAASCGAAAPAALADDALQELARLLDEVAAAFGARPIAGNAAGLDGLRQAVEAAVDEAHPIGAGGATMALLVAAARGARLDGGLPAAMGSAAQAAGIEPAPPLPRDDAPKAQAKLASLSETRSARFRGFMEELNAFAREHKLREMRTWSKVWEYPWLWFNGLAQTDWRGRRVVDLGSEISPMPWLLAKLGAEVLLVEADGQWVDRWEQVRTALGVSVRWSIVDDERIEAPDGWADAVISFSVIEHQPEKRRAIDEAVRALKPGGLLALSFDICEPSMQMSFPEWNGRALTMAEFERDIWRHPALDPGRRPEWNLVDIPAFLGWHRDTAPHHNYITGAAVLPRR